MSPCGIISVRLAFAAVDFQCFMMKVEEASDLPAADARGPRRRAKSDGEMAAGCAA